MKILLITFQVILFGTLVETGTAYIHSVNERIQAVLTTKGKELQRWQRPVLAILFLSIAFGISTFGLINLIAKGYGTIAWGFLFVFILPILTLGVYKVRKR